jgi:hypothetical protein
MGFARDRRELNLVDILPIEMEDRRHIELQHDRCRVNVLFLMSSGELDDQIVVPGRSALERNQRERSIGSLRTVNAHRVAFAVERHAHVTIVERLMPSAESVIRLDPLLVHVPHIVPTQVLVRVRQRTGFVLAGRVRQLVERDQTTCRTSHCETSRASTRMTNAPVTLPAFKSICCSLFNA